MRNYRYAPLAHKSTGREPLHDINSHACDSLRTYAEGDERGMVPRSAGLAEIEERAMASANVTTTGFDFWE